MHPSLPHGEIHIWQADLNLQADHTDILWPLLSDREKPRAASFHFEQDRNRYIIAHGTLRQLIGRYLNVPAQEVLFNYGDYGKPELDTEHADGHIYFNMSHSSGTALYGFARACPIGVDIEKIKEISEMDNVVDQFFSANEKKIFNKFAPAKKMRAFYRCWTLKEAFVKATGQGLNFPLNSLDVSIDPDEAPRLFKVNGDEKEASQWLIQELTPGNGMAAAVSARGGPFQVHHAQWTS